MSTKIQFRRGTTAQHTAFTGAGGEITVDTTKKTVVVHDGTTAGGTPLATEASVTALTPLNFVDKFVETTDWAASTTYVDYGFEAVITCTDVTAGMYAEVVFPGNPASSGNFAPVCDTGSGTVTIYAIVVPAADITLPLIRVVSII